MQKTLTLDQTKSLQPITIRPNSQSGRDAITGRFVRGNRAAVGRVSSARRNLIAFRNIVGESEIVDLAEMLLNRARQGDICAARILLDYALPRPNEIVRIDDRNEREAEDEKQRRELLANIGRGL